MANNVQQLLLKQQQKHAYKIDVDEIKCNKVVEQTQQSPT